MQKRQIERSDSLTCSILVLSCDKYRDLWTPFFRLFNRYWPDCPLPLYLGTNREQFNHSQVTSLQGGPDEGWGRRLRCFLESLDSEYVLLMLEDFFLDRTVSTAEVQAHLALLDRMQGLAMRLFPNPPADYVRADYVDEAVGILHARAAFRVSLQATLWKREGLVSLLADHESPWAFEIEGSRRSWRYETGFFCALQPVIHYQHVVERGEWFRSAALRYSREQIGCDLNARRIMGPWKNWRKKLFNRLRRIVNKAHSRWLCAVYPERPSRTITRVALLTNLIPPYHKPLYALLSQRYRLRLLLSTAMETNRPWQLEWDGLDVVVQQGFTLRRTWRHPRFGEALHVHFPLDTIQQLQRFRPDALISAEMGFRTLLSWVYVRFLNHECRLIIWSEVTRLTEQGRGAARQILRRFLARRVDGFLAVGTEGVRYIESLGVSRERIFEIAYSIDLASFLAVPLERSHGETKRLLFSGQLIQRKGLQQFIDTLALWANAHRSQNIEFSIVGGGPMRTALAQIPLPENVKLLFIGTVEYSQLPAIYAQAEVFVLPTMADTWAVVVNEALASGLPVLGSLHSQAVTALVEDGKTGWTYRPDEPGELYRVLAKALSASPAQLHSMGAQARLRASEITPQQTAEVCHRALNQT